jgi:hypothetical protein
MIDELVQLTVSEVPLAYNHPDAEVTSKLLFRHGYVRQQLPCFVADPPMALLLCDGAETG